METYSECLIPVVGRCGRGGGGEGGRGEESAGKLVLRRSAASHGAAGGGLTIPLNFWGTLQSPRSPKRAITPLSDRRRPLVAGPRSRSPLPRTRRKARSGRGRRSPQATPAPQGRSAKTYRDSRAVSSRRYNSRRPGAGRWR